MKKISFFLLASFVLSCQSVKKHNEQHLNLISPENLREDVDFAYQKLQELHPNLYWYISKKEFEYKIDSLKKTINKPITPTQFYFKLQPVIANVKEGHLSLKIPVKKFSKKQKSALRNKKGLFGRFEYYIHNDHLYFVENKDSIQNIKPGTELLSINDVPVSTYLKKYRNLISSDGYNTTFYSHYLKDIFFNFFVAEKGMLDSVKIETLYNDEKQTLVLKREPKNKVELKKEKSDRKRTKQKKLYDYVASTYSYNRDFKFLDQDSTTAYIKIKSFSRLFADKFYKDAFNRIENAKSQFLIIDIRDNYGGSLYEINQLYSYLSPEPFSIIKPAQLSSKFSPLRTNYFRKSDPVKFTVKSLAYPAYFIHQAFSVYKGKDGVVYYKMKESKTTKPKKNAFKGKVYVLINGGSFSASSILSSKLKYDKRATLVGEETGGANDGTVAGFYSYQKLPHSQINFPIGLLLVQPNIAFTNSKKGVVPDVEIIEYMQNIVDNKDVQLDWVERDIEKLKHDIKQNY